MEGILNIMMESLSDKDLGLPSMSGVDKVTCFKLMIIFGNFKHALEILDIA